MLYLQLVLLSQSGHIINECSFKVQELMQMTYNDSQHLRTTNEIHSKLNLC